MVAAQARDGRAGVTFLGIDVGTSAVKAVLVDERQRLAGRGRGAAGDLAAAPALVGAGPGRLVGGDLRGAGRAARRAPDAYAAVQAIGLSGQMHGAVVLDAADRPLRPAILWNDGRAQAECRLLAERVPDLGRIAGVPADAGVHRTQAALARGARARRCSPASHMVLLPKDYVRAQAHRRARHRPLSMPPARSGSTRPRRAWSPEILAATGLTAGPDAAHRRRLRAGWRAARRASPPSSACRPGIPSPGGAGDAAAGAIGIGAVDDGDALRLARHLGAVLRHHRQLPALSGAADPRLLPRPAGALVPDARRCSTAPAASAGRRGCSASPTSRPCSPGSRRAWRGPSRVLFLPYLAGERTPHDDPHARGVLFGLDADTGRDRRRPGGDGGRRLLARRGAGLPRGRRHRRRRHRRHRRRRPQPVLDAPARHRARPAGHPLRRRREGPGLRRRTARAAGRYRARPVAEVCGKPEVARCWSPSSGWWTPTAIAASASGASTGRCGHSSRPRSTPVRLPCRLQPV